MVTFKSFNDVVLDMIRQLQLVQPNLDTKPNSVARDLFIDGQALQTASVYEELREISTLQSISNVTGQDLTNYASNFGVERKTGTKAIGTVLFTFRSMDDDVTIPAGSAVRTRQSIPFITISTVTALASQSNSLRATATRFRNQLDTVGITDEFAIEVSVEAQSSGSAGNISSYSIISHSVPNANSVTNITSFTAGTDLEDDEAFRARVLAVFAGANVGTALGYRSVVLELPDTIDALVVEPGDPLMIRDGTVVVTDSDGNLIVSEPGTGGRVDIYILGENLQPGVDSFVFNDLSGRDDPTDSENDFILGHSSLTADSSLTLNSRRVATLSGDSEIPNQPVSNIVSVSGSISGPNFVEQFTDSAGNLDGNYVLVKDTGSAGGSSFGLDKIAWTSDRVKLTDESRNKGDFNSIDGLAFTDVIETPAIRQDVQVTNENSLKSSSSRSFITMLHTPVRTVSRVFNLTTGERYTIVDQNPDSTDTLNSTGRIEISGRTLPTVSDVLQTDYTWVREFDPFIDFDNFDPRDPLDLAQDSVEWGFSNYIRNELTTVTLDSYNNLTLQTSFPISRLLSINTFQSETSTVVSATTGKTVQVTTAVTNVSSITDNSLDGAPEVFDTKENDGNFSNLVIALPSDTLAQGGDSVTVLYNLVDLLDVDGYETGLILNNQVTLLPSNIVSSGTTVSVNYVANFFNILPSTEIAALPVSTDGLNSFSGVDGYQPVQNNFSGTTVVSNQRRSPTNISVTTSSLPGNGTLKISGTTINVVSSVFAATRAGNTIDLSIAIREAEGLALGARVPSDISIARVISVEAVTLTTSNEVSAVATEYDVTNYEIKDSKWDRANALETSTLGATEVKLANVSANTSDTVTTGTILRVKFYYSKANDYENLFFSRNGTAITNKVFGNISSINRVSGFQDSGGTVSGKIVLDTSNQPTEASTYFVDYHYTAPKENERITVNFEYNKLIVDATETVEAARPITADVLEKAATKIELDVEATIIVLSAFATSEATVQQNVADNIAATLNANALGTTLDSSDIVNNIYNVDGVDRVRITRFNKTGVTGTKVSISAQKSEYLAPGIITVSTEER